MSREESAKRENWNTPDFYTLCFAPSTDLEDTRSATRTPMLTLTNSSRRAGASSRLHSECDFLEPTPPLPT